eukprot:TRINITY_DN113758_c0_g1_i1.p1 TRINITY_DN113758_c0_g1~~TRINITY_DN113758_c0_g1_i1.p1  ORF type:complete len:320 (-),score=59.39 TRINITY_DN113758_c0_g1_i1:54-1013(-)
MDGKWRNCLAEIVSPDLLQELELDVIQRSEVDEDAPAFALFDDDAEGCREAELSDLLEGCQASLNLEDIPEIFRSPHYFRVFKPGGKDNSLALPAILGSSVSGHGDVVWASAELCTLKLIQGEVENLLPRPLKKCKVLEVGAGVGLPSCAALRCGAACVVASDIGDPQRLLALATTMALNLKIVHRSAPDACSGKVVGHRWGEGCLELRQFAQDGGGGDSTGFDLILCCDCLYFPELHGALVDTLATCLADDGIALVFYSLHGNTSDEKVLNFFEIAKDRGMGVEAFAEQQLPSRCANMPPKRSYVYAVKLWNLKPLKS